LPDITIERKIKDTDPIDLDDLTLRFAPILKSSWKLPDITIERKIKDTDPIDLNEKSKTLTPLILTPLILREARQEIFEYIEVFYNRQRRHSTIGCQTPMDFEQRRRKVA
jgi:transposase InsO family protein